MNNLNYLITCLSFIWAIYFIDMATYKIKQGKKFSDYLVWSIFLLIIGVIGLISCLIQ